MAKKKSGRPAKASSGANGKQAGADAADIEGTVGPSPAAEARANARLGGGVTAIPHALGPGEKSLAATAGGMVTIPRLDRTIKYDGIKYYPSDEPIDVPYAAAVTHGLIGFNEADPPSHIQAQSLLTSDDRQAGTPAADNGTGGEGQVIGTELPATEVADQAPTRDEIADAHPASEADEA